MIKNLIYFWWNLIWNRMIWNLFGFDKIVFQNLRIKDWIVSTVVSSPWNRRRILWIPNAVYGLYGSGRGLWTTNKHRNFAGRIFTTFERNHPGGWLIQMIQQLYQRGVIKHDDSCHCLEVGLDYSQRLGWAACRVQKISYLGECRSKHVSMANPKRIDNTPFGGVLLNHTQQQRW